MKSFFLIILSVFFLQPNTIAFAEDVTIVWKDLSFAERNRILNEWRALERSERGPFIQYRDKAIAAFDEAKKAQYLETAENRIKRKEAVEKSHAEKQKIEELEHIEKHRLEDAKIDSAATLDPIVTEPTPSAIEPIAPSGTDIEPITTTQPATDVEEKPKVDQNLIDKFFGN